MFGSIFSPQTAASLAALLGSASARGIDKEIWLAIRTDSKAGSGTEEDPYNVGGADDNAKAIAFDTMLDSIAANTTAHTKVNLKAGQVFPSNGTKWQDGTRGFTVRSGLYVNGNGATVKLVNYPNNWTLGVSARHSLFSQGSGDPASDNCIFDNLTVDCNWQNLSAPGTNKVVSGINVKGSHNQYRNIIVKNSHGERSTGNECFSLSFGSPSTGSTNNWAFNCVALTPQGDYQSALAFFGYDATHLMTDSGAIGCRCIGHFTSGLANIAYNDGLLFQGCSSDGASGIYHDTGVSHNVAIRGCVFRRIGQLKDGCQGVADVVADNTDSGWSVQGCVFEVTGGTASHNYGLLLSAQSQVNSNASGNIFLKDTSGGTNYRPLYCQNLNGASITDNLFSDKSAIFEKTVGGTGISLANNTGFDGVGCFAFADTRHVQVITAASGSVQLDDGVEVVRLSTALTGALTLLLPRSDCFKQIIIADPDGLATSTNTVSVGRNAATGQVINGGSSNITVIAQPYGIAFVVSDGVGSGGKATVRGPSVADSDAQTLTNKTVQAASGSSTTPGLSFASETNTGFFRNAGGDIRFVLGGSTLFRLTGTSFNFANTELLVWGASGVSTIDSGIARTSAGLVEINNGTAGTWRDLKVRQHYVDQTITAAGTTGAQTINKAAGTVNFAAGASSLVVTNSLVTTNSTIYCFVRTNDTTALLKNVVPAAGSFTINLNAAATAETSVGFLVIN
jgi:hypothetical protein